MDKVTREELKRMKDGETRTFTLLDAAACNSAKSLAYQTQVLIKCKFKIYTDYKNNRLTITKTVL